MNTDVTEWWQEYDRRQWKKVARTVAVRWLNDPVEVALPDDMDLWDEMDRNAFLTAWVTEMEQRYPDAGDTLDPLVSARYKVDHWSPQDYKLDVEKQRRTIFLDILAAAWKAKKNREI